MEKEVDHQPRALLAWTQAALFLEHCCYLHWRRLKLEKLLLLQLENKTVRLLEFPPTSPSHPTMDSLQHFQ